GCFGGHSARDGRIELDKESEIRRKMKIGVQEESREEGSVVVARIIAPVFVEDIHSAVTNFAAMREPDRFLFIEGRKFKAFVPRYSGIGAEIFIIFVVAQIED